MSQFFNNAIFWVEVDKIKPNPFQPRREFDEAKLNELAKSIRQYGVIQPLTVSRKEVEKPDGGLATEYELIAGERRLRASKIAGIVSVPVLIRAEYDDDKTKLELAIIENLQREELNPIDRAKAFDQLVKQFGFKHAEVAEKVGKSREYVSNSLRLLALPQEMQDALRDGKISEGHTRPLLMLADRPAEQDVLFREIMLKKLTVRDTEAIARRIAFDKVRKKEYLYAPEILEMERELTDALGTRVAIEPKENGGKLTIDYMTEDDLRVVLSRLSESINRTGQESPLRRDIHSSSTETPIPSAAAPVVREPTPVATEPVQPTVPAEGEASPAPEIAPDVKPAESLDDRSAEEKDKDENTFDPNHFSI